MRFLFVSTEIETQKNYSDNCVRYVGNTIRYYEADALPLSPCSIHGCSSDRSNSVCITTTAWMQIESPAKAQIGQAFLWFINRVFSLPAPICGCNAGTLESKRPSK